MELRSYATRFHSWSPRLRKSPPEKTVPKPIPRRYTSPDGSRSRRSSSMGSGAAEPGPGKHSVAFSALTGQAPDNPLDAASQTVDRLAHSAAGPLRRHEKCTFDYFIGSA